VSDEEGGGSLVAKYLVENHASLFGGIRYAIGEFGGFSFYVGKKKFFPIMVAEKGVCVVEAILTGPSGHPTATFHGGAMAKLGKVLQQLEQKRLPVHITTVTRLMVQTMTNALPFPSNIALRQLLNQKMTDRMLRLFGKQVEQFEPLLHNSINPTIITGADSHKIPDSIGLQLVCNLLPGYKPEDVISELHQVIGKDIELKVINATFYESLPAEPDMGLFDTLAGILREAEPDCTPCPLLLPAPTDGRLFSRLGIQTYGFLPMNLPPNFSFWQLTHGVDERIPVDALAFGTDAIFKLLQCFGK
jgi:acetylornithine deacetylase/succinyl-diaminopimelate desuccinylase-like protein